MQILLPTLLVAALATAELAPEPAAASEKAGAEEGALAGKKGEKLSPAMKKELVDVYMSVHHINPLDKRPPDCGLFIQTNQPGRGGGLLLHVTGGSHESEHLAVKITEAVRPEGLVHHSVGKMLRPMIEQAVAIAKSVPPQQSNKDTKVLADKNCLAWPKAVAGQMRARGMLRSTMLQKAGSDYARYSGPVMNAAFMGMYAAPMIKSLIHKKNGKLSVSMPSAQQMQQMKQHWHNQTPLGKPGGPPPGYPMPGAAAHPMGAPPPAYAAHASGAQPMSGPVPGYPVYHPGAQHMAGPPPGYPMGGMAPAGGPPQLTRRGKVDDHIYDEDLLGDGEFESGGGAQGGDTNSGGDDGSHENVDKGAGDYQGGGNHGGDGDDNGEEDDGKDDYNDNDDDGDGDGDDGGDD